MPMGDDELKEGLEKLKLYKTKVKQYEGKIQILQRKLCREMARRDMTAVEYDDLRASMVIQQSTFYNVERLARELPASEFKRITKPVIDKSALQARIAAGKVDPEVVAGCTEVTPKAPYILVSDR